MKRICLTFDVEDSSSPKPLLDLLYKYNIKATFFVTGIILEKNPSIISRIRQEGHEIGCHGYSHKRFDELPIYDKVGEIRDFLTLSSKNKIKVYGFRAPQFSIDKETLDVLKEYNLKYDSSYAPGSFAQILFFPNKILRLLKLIFSPNKIYYHTNDLKEIPASSFIFPISTFSLRYFPQIIFRMLVALSSISRNEIVFLSHSWDFEDKKILVKLEKFIRLFDKEAFVRMSEIK